MLSTTSLLGLTLMTLNAVADPIVGWTSQSSWALGSQDAQKSEASPTPSAAIDSAHGLYLFAGPLYWHASVGNADWAFQIPDSFFEVAQLSSVVLPVHQLNFKWNWGFRVGIGVNTDYDGWDSTLYYTWFQTHSSDRVKSDLSFELGLIGPLGDQESLYVLGKIDGDIHFSMFDWQLGRSFYVGQKLAIRPHVGLKGGWIHQPVNMAFQLGREELFAAFSYTKNNFWGVGVSGGANTLWLLGYLGQLQKHRFSLVTDFGAALMYGHFHNTLTQKFQLEEDLPFAIIEWSGLSRNLLVMMVEGGLGFSWDVPFNRDKNHFTFKLGYEFQYWLRQNQMVNNTYFINLMRRSDDLGLQGLSGEFRFDF